MKTLYLLSLCLISLALCDVKNIEDIKFILGPSSIRASMSTPFEIITCEMDWLMEFDTELTVDASEKIINLFYPHALDYHDKLEKLETQIKEFSKCQMDSVIKYSDNKSRFHLNLNPTWNNGFIVKNVNLITKESGDWTVKVKIEDNYYKRQFMVIYLNFEKLRSKDEIDQLVAWLKTLIASS